MSKHIEYSKAFRQAVADTGDTEEIIALRDKLRFVIAQRDHWQARYAEVTQQLDEMRKAAEGVK